MDEKILLLALADSVNPCTLAIMILLLAVLLGRRGKKDALIGGILFIGTIYIMYTLYGLGLLSFITTTALQELIRGVLPFILLILALWELKAYFFYKPGFSSAEMPMFLRPLAKRSITAVSSPLIAIPVAALCSILLLPCSSGPYLTALFLMGGIADLLLYNAVFVLPMVLILILFLVGLSPKHMEEIRRKRIREIHLISGLLLLVVFFLVFPFQTSATSSHSSVYLVSSPTCPHCQHLEEVLREMNIPVTHISPEEGRKMAQERGVNWDGGVPLLIVGDTVIEGFPAKYQDVNGMFPDEEETCKKIGTPVYQNGRYLYCVLRNGAILGNRRVLGMFVSQP